MAEAGPATSLVEDESEDEDGGGAERGSDDGGKTGTEDDGKTSGNVYFGGAGSTMFPKVEALGV